MTMFKIDKINKIEALGYMGVKGGKTLDLLSEMTEIEKELLSLYSPMYCYKKYSICEKNDGLLLDGTTLKLCGEDIKNHLYGYEQAILIAATISFKVDKYIKSLQLCDMKKAIMADSLASALIEQVCDLAELEIKKLYPTISMTTRYSPGYGDLDISLQKNISDLLNTQKNIGLFVNESYMMIPSKSVIAIIGIKNQ